MAFTTNILLFSILLGRRCDCGGRSTTSYRARARAPRVARRTRRESDDYVIGEYPCFQSGARDKESQIKPRRGLRWHTGM